MRHSTFLLIQPIALFKMPACRKTARTILEGTMRRTTLAVAVLVIGVEVHAGVVYNDGGTHTVSGPSGTIDLLSGTLNVQTGAVITGDNDPSLIVPGPGIFATGASTQLNISGGTITGYTPPSNSFPDFPLPGINMGEGASATITGGTISPGRPSPSGDTGPAMQVSSGGSIIIQGGMFNQPNGGIGSALFVEARSLAIQGGTFNGPVATQATPTVIQGGTFMGMVAFTQGGFVTIQGGTFSNGEVSINTNIVISGGNFNVDTILLVLPGGANYAASFTGSNLSFTGSTTSGGYLTGTLGDGTAIDVNIGFHQLPGFLYTVQSSPTEVTFNLVSTTVPEPSTIIIAASGLLPAAVFAWYHRMRKHAD
jgi:hypothetical protein